MLPASVNTYGTTHAVLSNGIAQNETGVLLDACRQAGIPFSRLQEFASADWQFCRAFGRATLLRACFSEARERAWTESLVFRAGGVRNAADVPGHSAFPIDRGGPFNMLSDQIVSYEALGEVLRFVCG